MGTRLAVQVFLLVGKRWVCTQGALPLVLVTYVEKEALPLRKILHMNQTHAG